MLTISKRYLFHSRASNLEAMADQSAPPPEDDVDVLAIHCPSRAIFEQVTSKWTALVLIALAGRSLRFGELRRTVQGVSEKMLSQSLRSLERDGMIVRTAYDCAPPRVEYALTPLGTEVSRQIRDLADVLQDAVPEVARSRERHNLAM